MANLTQGCFKKMPQRHATKQGLKGLHFCLVVFFKFLFLINKLLL